MFDLNDVPVESLPAVLRDEGLREQAVKLRDAYFGKNAEFTEDFVDAALDALSDCMLRTEEAVIAEIQKAAGQLGKPWPDAVDLPTHPQRPEPFNVHKPATAEGMQRPKEPMIAGMKRGAGKRL